MDRIILKKRNYKIWSNLIMGELEEANLEHAITLNLSDNTIEGTTEGITEGILNVNTISAKEDSKPKRIIYIHLSEVTWE